MKRIRKLIPALVVALLAVAPVRAQDPETELRNKAYDLEQRLTKLQNRLRDRELETQSLRAEIADLKRELTALRGQRPKRRESREFDPGTGTGTIRIRNPLRVTATVTIDGERYDLPAGTSITLRNRPAREFTYRVDARGLRDGQDITTCLHDNETLTLNLRLVYDE